MRTIESSAQFCSPMCPSGMRWKHLRGRDPPVMGDGLFVVHRRDLGRLGSASLKTRARPQPAGLHLHLPEGNAGKARMARGSVQATWVTGPEHHY